jgi:hypothetical protein
MSHSLPLSWQTSSPSRLRPISAGQYTFSAWEALVLVMAGGAAAAAVGLVELRLQIPGHSILHTVVPMSVGLSLVPRRYSGTGMSCFAGLTAAGLMAAGRGEFGAGAWTSLLTMGPCLDLMLWSRWGQRWPAFSVAVAGLLANTLAFLAKAIEKWSSRNDFLPGSGMGGGMGLGGGGGNGMGGGRGLGGGMGRSWESWIAVAPYTYLLCGLMAGLVCGVALFHLRRKASNPSTAPSSTCDQNTPPGPVT